LPYIAVFLLAGFGVHSLTPITVFLLRV
jgi:hypothetical protein